MEKFKEIKYGNNAVSRVKERSKIIDALNNMKKEQTDINTKKNKISEFERISKKIGEELEIVKKIYKMLTEKAEKYKKIDNEGYKNENGTEFDKMVKTRKEQMDSIEEFKNTIERVIRQSYKELGGKIEEDSSENKIDKQEVYNNEKNEKKKRKLLVE